LVFDCIGFFIDFLDKTSYSSHRQFPPNLSFIKVLTLHFHPKSKIMGWSILASFEKTFPKKTEEGNLFW